MDWIAKFRELLMSDVQMSDDFDVNMNVMNYLFYFIFGDGLHARS